jgi:hypothetical protein
MKRAKLLLAVFTLAAGCDRPTQPTSDDGAVQPRLDSDARDIDTQHRLLVRVARPTGNSAMDVANIQAAVAAATPGAIIQFARGIYAMDATTQIEVSVPGVVLRGHKDGTTIRGVPGSAPDLLTGDFLLNGGGQTVSHLTFERFSLPLSFGEAAPAERTGGYRLEHCTFRNGDQPFDFVGFSEQVSIVRDNRFINVSLAFVILGKTVHFIGNSVTAPRPELAAAGQPLFVGLVLPEFLSGINVCENNRFEHNRVVGISDGILLIAEPGQICRNNVVRKNLFISQRVFVPFDNGSMVVLIPGPGVSDNLIAENELRGGEGLGIIAVGGTRNRIVRNRLSDLPGEKETFTPFPGTAIFLDEPTFRNRVIANEFENVVNEVVDLGTNNVVRNAPLVRAAAAGSTLRVPAVVDPLTKLSKKLQRFRARPTD